MKPHTAIGIATVIFYSPITLYAQYIGIRCWKYGSRMACYMIMAFTISMYRLFLLQPISCCTDCLFQYDSPAAPCSYL
jgi:hypothetical protein